MTGSGQSKAFPHLKSDYRYLDLAVDAISSSFCNNLHLLKVIVPPLSTVLADSPHSILGVTTRHVECGRITSQQSMPLSSSSTPVTGGIIVSHGLARDG